MAETIRRLANGESYSALQDKINTLKDLYSVRCVKIMW